MKKKTNPTIQLLMERGSCRNFTKDPVPQNVLEQILDAGIHAPSGGNLQPFSIIKIKDEATRKRLAEIGEQAFIAKAPVSLLFCIDFWRLRRWAELEIAPFTATDSLRHFWIAFQDTIISAQNICTAADALGLGSVYIGTIIEDLDAMHEMFHLPKGVFPVVLLCLGYPKKAAPTRKKLKRDVIVHDEYYHKLEDTDLLEAYNEKYAERKGQITDKRLETIKSVCQTVHSEEFAQRCLARIEEQGFINAVQHYFGLHYRADIQAQGNNEFLEKLKEFGFTSFSQPETTP